MSKYLLIGGWREIQLKDEITKEDLGAVKNKDIDWLINTQEGTYFDAETNEWKKIEDFQL